MKKTTKQLAQEVVDLINSRADDRRRQIALLRERDEWKEKYLDETHERMKISLRLDACLYSMVLMQKTIARAAVKQGKREFKYSEENHKWVVVNNDDLYLAD